MSEGYTRDHLNVLKALGTEIPKRPQLSTEDIVKPQFKDKGDKGDRVVRNAYRKLRERGLIEIADRGMYRLTPAGVKLVTTVKEKGVGDLLQERKAVGKKSSKPKKAAKKAAKPAAKKAVKAKPKKAAKPAAKKSVKAKAPAKKVSDKKPAVTKAKAPAKASDNKPKNGKPSKLSAALPKKADKPAEKTPEKAAEKSATLPM